MATVHVKRLNTALRGAHVRIDLSDDAFAALEAAVRVAFDDADSVPPEYAEGAAALWNAIDDKEES